MKPMFAALILASSASLVAATDWNGFRGEDAYGVSPDQSTPTTWSNSENLLWKTPLPGPGSSSPIVHGSHVYLTCYSGYGESRESAGRIEDLKRHLVCVDRVTGKIVWDTPVAAEMPEDSYQGFIAEHGYASSTPVTDGERIFAFFGKSGICAFDMDGKKLWQKNVGKESSSRRWGSAASPILYKDFVIVNASEESQSIRAFDKVTGEEKWKAEAAGLELCYGTPAIVKNAAGEEELVIAVAGEIWSLDPDNGKFLWYVTTPTDSPLSPSVVVDDGIVYSMGSRNGGTVAVKVGGKGDVTKSNTLWSIRETAYTPSPALYDGHLYWVDDRGQAFCVNATDGKLIYRERVVLGPGSQAEENSGPGRRGGNSGYYASIVIAGDKIYAVSRRSGTFVLAASPEFKVLANNKFEGDDTDFNSSPAISDGQLFLRSNKFLYAIGSK